MGQLASLFEDDKPKAALNLRFGIEAQPDAVARDAALAKRFGLPPGVIAEYRPDYEAKAKVEDAQPLLDQAPKLRGWLAADVKRAEIAHDDIGPLSAIESAIKYLVSAPGAPRGGLISDAGNLGVTGIKGAVGLPQAMVGLANIPTMGRAGMLAESAGIKFKETQRLLDDLYSPAQQEANRAVQSAEGFTGTLAALANNPSVIVHTALESVPQMLGGASIARGLLSMGGRGVAAGAAGPVLPAFLARKFGDAAPLIAGAAGEGIMAAGAATEQYRKEGGDLSVGQVAAAIASGAGTGLLAVLGGKVAQKLGITDIDTALAGGRMTPEMAKHGLLRSLAEAGISEGLLEEMPQSAQEQIWQNLATDQPILDGVAEAAAMGLVAGAATGGAFAGMSRRMVRNDQSAADAERRAGVLNEATMLIEAGKLRNRDPDSFAEFADELVANDVPNLYIDAQTLNQSGINMDEVMQAMPSVAAQIERAVATGGDLVIPTSEFLTITPGKPFAAALIDHARTAANAMSPAEAKQYMAERGDTLNAEIARVLDERQADDEFQAQRQEVKDYFVGELNATERFTPDVMDAYASMLSGFYSAMAVRANMAPGELLQRYGLKASAQPVAGNRTMEQADVESPAFREWFGDSKVRDAQGKPLVVYHGAPDARFATGQGDGIFKTKREAAFGKDDGRAFFFAASQGVARTYADPKRSFDYQNAEEGIVQVYLSLRNPMEIDAKGEHWRGTEAVIQQARDAGHDGVIIRNSRDTYQGRKEDKIKVPITDVYVAFRPEQIKSATGNNGNYDPTNPSILYQSAQTGAELSPEGRDFLVSLASVARESFALNGDSQSVLVEPQPDGLPVGAKNLSDLAEGEPALPVQEGGLSGQPALVAMLAQMRAAVFNDPQILDAVVGAVPVNVVDNLFGSQAAAKVALHDEAMLKDSAAFNADLSVPGGLGNTSDAVFLLVREATSRAAELARVSLRTGVEPQELIATADASQRNTFNQGGAPRAQITFASDITLAPSVISLLADADLSGFVHESGHFYLEVMGDLASRIQGQINDGLSVSDGERGIVADMNRLLGWFGINGSEQQSALDEWLMMSMEDRRNMHERFARGFELYAFEGKAPSVELGGVFRKFRSWLMNVYRVLTNLAARDALQVTLTDEVRGVMDRMLATDEQIAEAEAARGMGPLFRTAEQAGMTADEWKAYNDRALDATAQAIENLQARGLKDMQWLQNARSRRLRELQKRAEGLRREVRMQARADVMARPVYRAWQFLVGKDDPQDKTDAELALAAERADHRERRKTAEAAALEAEKARVLAETPDVKGLPKAQLMRREKRQMDINVQQAMLAWDQENPAPGPEKVASTKVRRDALDITRDSLLVAVAKLGGINRDSVKRDLSVADDDLKIDVGVFGSKPFRATGGRTADDMAHALAELHYLPFDEDGKVSIRELEEALMDELGGSPRYSYAYDYARANGEDIQPLSDDVRNGKINTERLREMYGNKADAVWRKLSARRMTSDTGFDPDVVAATFDFSSGDELVKAIADAVPPREVIEALTDERMLAEFGDLATPEGLERAADAAVHNDARARFVAAELEALESANRVRQGTPGTRRTVDVLAKAAKDYAESVVAALRIRDLRPDRYEAAEARAARNAIKAMKDGDTEKAAAEKRSQMIQSAAARAAIAAQNEMDRARDYFKRLSKGNKSIDRGYQDQIDALLERVELRQISDKASDRRKSLAEWVEEQRAMGVEPDIPDHLLESAARKSYRDMTVEEVRGLRDTIRNIEHLGRLKRKLLAAREQRDFDSAATELADSIIANGGAARDVELEGPKGFKPWLEGVAASHRKLSSLFRQMDGGDDNGPAHRLLGRGLNDRGNMEDAMTERATVALAELYAPIMKMRGGVSGASSKIHIREIGASLTRGGRLAVALNWGNDQNRQRIRDGDKWTDAQVQAILRTLTQEELQFVNGMWAYLDTFWPEIAAKETRLTGKEPERVEVSPFLAVAADGTQVQMRGGYYPLKYDSDRSDKAERQEAAEVAKDMMRGAFTRATTRRGHTKARAEEVKRAVRKDLSVITQHVTQVIHDLAWHEWLIDTNRLLSDDRVVDAIRTHYGPKVLKTMRDGVMGIATADVVPMTDVDKALLLLRSNVTRATMGASLTTAFLQPFGLTQSMVRIGPKHVLRGLARWGGEAVRLENSLVWIHEKSDFMRLRAKTFNREIRDISGRVAGKSAAMQAVDGGLFWMTQKMQLVADVPTWIGQYEKSLAAGATEVDAVAMADRAVIEAQGSGSTKDLAEVQRKHPMLTQFYSYFSVTLNLTAERTAATDFKNPRAVAGWLGDMALLLVIPAILPAMLMEGMKGGDDEEDLAKKIAKWQLGYLMGMVVGVRELSGMVSGFDYAGPPVGRIISDLGKAVKQTVQGEIDEPAVLAYVRLMGDAFGIPVIQAIRSYKGWKAWDEGEEGAGPQSVLLGPPVKD